MRQFAIRYLKILAVMCIFSVSLVGTYVGMHHERVFPRDDQVVIYGRDSCSITSALRAYLDKKAVPYVYADIDRPLMKFEFEAQLNLSEARVVPLPVVLVGRRTLESPDHETVINLWKEAKAAGS